MRKPLLKKIVITITAFIIFVLLLNYGASYWISKKLPAIINSEEKFPYNITYEDLDIQLLRGSIIMQNAFIAPKDSIDENIEQEVFGKIKSISIINFNLWALLKNNKIKVKRIIIDTPEIILHERDKKYNIEEDFVKPFSNTINTNKLIIKNGGFKMLSKKESTTLSANKINFEINTIRVDSASVKQNIPINYKNYSFECDSLFYQVDEFYHITAKSIKNNDTSFTVQNFKFVPEYNRAQFTQKVPKEKDLFNLKAEKIDVKNLDWGFINDSLYVHSDNVILDKVYANIYRNKIPEDDLSTKKLYNELLRSLNFDLKVKKLELKNAVIEYEEQINFEKPSAMVSFSKFYATITNINSPINKHKLPLVNIDVQCLFMKAAPLKVKWSFDVMDRNDSFTISGHLQNIKSEQLNKVTKGLMNATTSGNLKEVIFKFKGNKEKSWGTFEIDYDDLKVDIYKKDGKKKNKLVSALGNLIVKSDSNDKLKKVDVGVDRIKEKSFYNLLWRTVEDGLKKTVLPKAVNSVI